MTVDGPLTADYVVVGSGAGGGAVAFRLAEAGHSVIVIEAGAAVEDTLTYSVPAFHAYASEDPEMAWNFYVHHYDDPQREARDGKFRPEHDGVLYPRCGTVGGCTAHNAMIIVYPNDSDWDAIAELTGDSSWRAEAMRPLFERLTYSERADRLLSVRGLARRLLKLPFVGEVVETKTAAGRGWLPVQTADPLLITHDWVLLAVVATAVKNQLKDTLGRHLRWTERLLGQFNPNSPQAQRSSMLGVWLIPLSVGRGQRSGTREALREASARGRLRVLDRTLAASLILDETGRCVGVRCLRGAHLYGADPSSSRSGDPGEPFEVRATREVIVSGGAFNTPQLLKLSGIGPADELAAHGIDVRVASPGVGTNLQDRYEVGVVTELPEDFTLVSGGAFHPPQPGEPRDRYLERWQRHRRGPYTTNGAVLAVMAKSRPELEIPDLFLFALPANFRGYYPGYARDLELKSDTLTWAVLKAHTHNRAGTVTLRSPDPRETPDIRFRYFDEGSAGAEDDLSAVVEGVRFARGITARLAKRGAVETWPGPAVADEELRGWVRDNAWGHHACGTCAIGADSDPYAVLDGQFRVRGVPGLRVVDASVFPSIPGYFLVSAVYMVGEKAADVILADARRDVSAAWPGPPPSQDEACARPEEVRKA